MADETPTEQPAPPRLTTRQRLFIAYYIGESHGNATDAARRAGYRDAEVSGYQNKQNPVIWQEIERRLRERTLASEEVLERLTQHASASLEPFLSLSGDSALVDLSSPQARANLHLLKKVKTKRRTGGNEKGGWEEVETEIELHDPQAALVHLGRYHALFTDRTEHSGKIEGVLSYRITPPESPAGTGDPDAGRGD